MLPVTSVLIGVCFFMIYGLGKNHKSQGACINYHIIILHYCKSENYLGTQGKTHHLYQFSIS